MSHYPKALLPVDHVEPVARRIRATIGPHTVLDTLRALYLWEWPYYPQYYIPAADVDPALIVEEDGTHRLKRGTVARLGISAGNVRRDRVAHRYLESTVAEIVGAVRFDWNALDAW